MKGWLKAIDNWVYQNRAMSLLLTIMLTLAAVSLANWLSGSDLFRQFFFPKICDKSLPATCDPLDWKDLFQAAILVLGLPVAFLLWHWRDTNVRDQIAEQRNQVEEQAKQVENSRKDINLKEFQEVQLRAAGALDVALPEDARQQLQIAALHQLRGFLRGEYGESFQRPAFELLLAGHAAAIYRIGVPDVQRQIGKDSSDLNWEDVARALKLLRSKLSHVDKERILIIRDEAEHIFHPRFPLESRRLDLLDLKKIVFAEGLFFRESSFFGANMDFADLKGANLYRANLQGASCFQTRLNGTEMMEVRLQYAHLSQADLAGSNLCWAKLQGASLHGASIRRADFRSTQITEGTVCEVLLYDNMTVFGDWTHRTWISLTEAEKEAARGSWIARGAVNVDTHRHSQPPHEQGN
jgi:Pentapeptide repeats (8 copies)